MSKAKRLETGRPRRPAAGGPTRRRARGAVGSSARRVLPRNAAHGPSLGARRAWALGALLALLGGGAARAAEFSAVPTFQASYEVEYKGHHVGREDLSVSYDAATQRYHFESRTQATGVLRLVRRRPSIQRTDFVLENGAIKPLEFWFDDGTRKGDDDRHIVFDWNRGVATVTHDSESSQIALEPHMLDAGTTLVAIMLDLSRGATPGPYRYTDGKAPSTYTYKLHGQATIETDAGNFRTTVVEQQSAGSSRYMKLWAAAKLGYLPAQIAQYKGDELLTQLKLESVEGLRAKAGADD